MNWAGRDAKSVKSEPRSRTMKVAAIIVLAVAGVCWSFGSTASRAKNGIAVPDAFSMQGIAELCPIGISSQENLLPSALIGDDDESPAIQEMLLEAKLAPDSSPVVNGASGTTPERQAALAQFNVGGRPGGGTVGGGNQGGGNQFGPGGQFAGAGSGQPGSGKGGVRIEPNIQFESTGSAGLKERKLQAIGSRPEKGFFWSE